FRSDERQESGADGAQGAAEAAMSRALNSLLGFSAASALLLLGGCGGKQPQQTMFNPAGPMSSRVEGLWWFIFWISLAVFVIVMAFFSGAAATRRVRGLVPPDIHPNPVVEQRHVRIVIAATVITVLVLFAILGHSLVTGKYMNSLVSKNPVSIEVIGHQWWWEVQYPNTDVSRWVVTANEIHVPTGTPVVLQTSSQDVIHSFWAPNIQGKRDLIPGYKTAIWFQADREGVFRGQCAEFCGHQHAHMAFLLVAESPEKFQSWLQHQREPASPPSDPAALHGEEVFLSTTCVMCHTIRGTDAGSKNG